MTTVHCLAVLAIYATVVPVAQAQPPSPEPATPRSVTLALTEYNRLIDLADRAASNGGAPLPAALSAVVAARIDGGIARGTVTVTGTAMRPGPSWVPLVAAATITEAPGGASAIPLVTDDGVTTAVVAGPGPFTLTLGWSAAVRTDGGRTMLTLPSPRTGTARAQVEVPGEPADVQVKGGTVTTRQRTPDGTALDVTLVPGTAAQVSWIAREVAAAAPVGPARVVSEVATLVTVTDTDVRVSAVVTLDVSRGQLPACTLTVPAGYRVAGVHGATVERTEASADGLRVTLLTPAAPRHVLLAELERPWPRGATTVEAVTVGVVEAQRERGDLAVESPGTTVVTESAAERADRVDVQEMGAGVRALARWPLLAAYRYQRATGAMGPRVSLGVARFADAEVAPAIVSAAAATTLVTTDGRALTDVRVRIENERQPFVKVGLPAGSRIVSVSLDDEPAKPVSGADGLRLPLLHAERGGAARELRYVYLHDGTPFARKGEMRLLLPTMDLPIGVVHWEVFVPDAIRARRIGGTAVDAARFDDRRRPVPRMPVGDGVGPAPRERPRIRISALQGGLPGQVRGRATETSGGPMPGVTVMLRNGSYVARVVTNERGEYVASGVPPGRVSLDASLIGFSAGAVSFDFDGQPVAVDVVLAVGALHETITVTGEAPEIDTSTSQPAPGHVLDLQQRVAGVLPIRIDVPRAGRSMLFVTPLVVDDAPSLTLRYSRR